MQTRETGAGRAALVTHVRPTPPREVRLYRVSRIKLQSTAHTDYFLTRLPNSWPSIPHRSTLNVSMRLWALTELLIIDRIPYGNNVVSMSRIVVFFLFRMSVCLLSVSQSQYWLQLTGGSAVCVSVYVLPCLRVMSLIYLFVYSFTGDRKYRWPGGWCSVNHNEWHPISFFFFFLFFHAHLHTNSYTPGPGKNCIGSNQIDEYHYNYFIF